jgi:hypothetical protein
MHEKRQEASDHCRDAGRVRRIRQAAMGFYVAFLAWLTRWLKDSWTG